MQTLQRLLLATTVLSGVLLLQSADATILDRSLRERSAAAFTGQSRMMVAEVVEPDKKLKPKPATPAKKPPATAATPPLAAPVKKPAAPPKQVQERHVQPNVPNSKKQLPPPHHVQAPKSPTISARPPTVPGANGKLPAVQPKTTTKLPAGEKTLGSQPRGSQVQAPLTPKQLGQPVGGNMQPPSSGGVASRVQGAPLSPSGLPKPSAHQAQPIPPSAKGAGIAPLSSKGQPIQRIDQLRSERHEIVEGNRTVIREPDRTIIRQGGERSYVTIIRWIPLRCPRRSVGTTRQ